VGLGAGLTPLGEPLSTILVQKLAGPPYTAGFLFPLQTLGIYIIPGVVAISIFGALRIGRKVNLKAPEIESEYSETLRTVIMRAIKVYIFIAALILLGEGLKPLIVWYFTKIPAWALFWINSLSAILDNATLTAVEIGPTMAINQIISATMALLIAGGMLIPGNIPNIVAAGRLKVNMKEWAVIGVPMGLVIMMVYFIALTPLIF
jgi:predicted cation transporter